MWQELFDFLHLHELGWMAILDVTILAVVIYQLLLLVRGTRAVQMAIGVIGVWFFYLVTSPGALHLRAVHNALGDLRLYIPFAIIVLFQNQIRQALLRIGGNPLSAFTHYRGHESVAEEVALAATTLAAKRQGALIILERSTGLRAYSQTGIKLEAVVTYDLLRNIFTPASPLHDGAVVIVEGRIQAAACYLPLTLDPTLSRTYGTRHRAAVGITEESDCLAVVVSEERGVVSLAENGKIVEDLDASSLADRIRATLRPRRESFLSRHFRRNRGTDHA
jgi:diadenylate cyclase